MHLAFDIFQGIGIAAALGIRPFLGSLVAGGLAAGDVEIHFDHTSYQFLQAVPFLAGMAALAIAFGLFELRRGAYDGPLAIVLAATALALGALFFGGSLSRAGHAAWPGLIGGVICAGVGLAGSRPFLARLRSRLDKQSAAVGVPVVAEGGALVAVALSVLAPPVGVLLLLWLLWLAWRGRSKEERKYAGLRILR
ncbi:MAG: hypothetical protein ACRDKL_02385 [Solirubrobacteraceae bacterium]